MTVCTMKTLVLQPLISTSLWLTLALSAVGLLAWYAASSRGRLSRGRWIIATLLMAFSLALPLGMLLNPTWIERLPPPEGKPRLIVLIDASASMKTRNASQNRSRFDEAAAIAAKLDQKLADRFDIALRTFSGESGQVRPVDLSQLTSTDPTGHSTDLALAITSSLEPDRPQGEALLLLSDGIDNAGEEARVLEAAQRAKAVAAPVYTRTLGGQAGVRDLAIEAELPQDVAFVGQQVPIRARLTAQGLSGAVAKVSLVADGKVVDRQEVRLSDNSKTGGSAHEVQFQARHDHSGVYRYELRAEPMPGEATTVNNTSAYVLRVLDEPIRILLLEGKPYWDGKFLTRTLLSDPAVELTSVVRLAEGRFLQRQFQRPAPESAPSPGTAPAPDKKSKIEAKPASFTKPAPADGQKPHGSAGGTTTADTTDRAANRTEQWAIATDGGHWLADPEQLATYQVVVLGRDAEVFLTDEAQARLRRWVSRDAGSLVCFRGPPEAQLSQRLAQMMPVRWTPSRAARFHLKLTADGESMHWLGDQPPGDSKGGGSQSSDPLAGMPTLASVAQPSAAQPQAMVWATGQLGDGNADTPVVTALPYGTGRVVVVEGAGMWRWAFLPPSQQQHSQVYAALWGSLTRWLATNTGLLPSQSWLLRTDKTEFTTGESAAGVLLVRESALGKAAPTVELTSERLAHPQTVSAVASGDEPGAFRIGFGRLQPGRYTARVIAAAASDPAAQTVFDVRPDIRELLQLDANPALMKRLAEASGGAALESASPEEVTRHLEKYLAASHPEQIRSTSAWDRWWILAAMLGTWGATWIVRRSSGLV
jgi:hypothetical protein